MRSLFIFEFRRVCHSRRLLVPFQHHSAHCHLQCAKSLLCLQSKAYEFNSFFFFSKTSTHQGVRRVNSMRLAICSAALVWAFLARFSLQRVLLCWSRALIHSPHACHSRSKAIGLPLLNAPFSKKITDSFTRCYVPSTDVRRARFPTLDGDFI